MLVFWTVLIRDVVVASGPFEVTRSGRCAISRTDDNVTTTATTNNEANRYFAGYIRWRIIRGLSPINVAHKCVTLLSKYTMILRTRNTMHILFFELEMKFSQPCRIKACWHKPRIGFSSACGHWDPERRGSNNKNAFLVCHNQKKENKKSSSYPCH